MSPIPLLLSPALPSELLTYILDHHVYPTTLIVCSTRTDHVRSLQDHVREQSVPDQRLPVNTSSQASTEDPNAPRPNVHSKQECTQHQLLSQTLSRLAVSRHIRTVYSPTVTHLRSWISVFSPEDSILNGPPSNFTLLGRKSPTLIVYGVIELHRDTSEWSAQGLGNTVAALVETASRLGWGLVMVEPQTRYTVENHEEGVGEEVQQTFDFETLLKEKLPILSGGARKPGLDSDEGSWSGRTVEVGRAMSRWFRFQNGPWNADGGI